MDYETFVENLAAHTDVPPGEAQRLSHAFLGTLTERLTGREGRRLAAQLAVPEGLVSPAPEAERFGLDEFAARVSRRARVSPHTARVGVRVGMRLLRDAVSPAEFHEVMDQLPREFEELAGVSG